MRTVLLGTDFVYDKNGLLRPIEINTNVGLDGLERLEDTVDEIFDFSNLTTFITNGAFTSVHYIGLINEFSQRLEQICNGLGISYEYHIVGRNSITIPYIDDNETTLIIRSSYDTTALVDDTYCKDKVEYLKLIKDQSFGHQFAYLNDENQLVSNITTISDNGIHPNFILKSRLPNYDSNLYPKLYKVTTQEELNAILQNVNSNYFLMEFHYNDSKKYHDHIRVIRSLNLLYPPSLESIFIGSYNKIVPDSLLDNESPIYDATTHELNLEQRYFYITDDGKKPNFPKLEDSDMVQLADGSFKTALDLEVGDLLKTIDLPDNLKEIPISHRDQYQMTFAELNGITYSNNRVVGKRRIDKLSRIAKITFSDGLEWFDVAGASYMVIKDGIVQFVGLASLTAGDKLILIDTTDNSIPAFVEKEIVSAVLERTFFTGWSITVEREHLFLVKADPNSSSNLQSFVSIEHNDAQCIRPAPSCNGPCSTQCPTCAKGYTCSPFSTCQIMCG